MHDGSGRPLSGKLGRVNLRKDFWDCEMWTVDRGKSIPEVFSNLTRPGFFQCFKRSKWSDGSRPSSEIIQMIDAFLPCRGDSTFFIIQRFLFNKSSTFFLPFFNCKLKKILDPPLFRYGMYVVTFIKGGGRGCHRIR